MFWVVGSILSTSLLQRARAMGRSSPKRRLNAVMIFSMESFFESFRFRKLDEVLVARLFGVQIRNDLFFGFL